MSRQPGRHRAGVVIAEPRIAASVAATRRTGPVTAAQRVLSTEPRTVTSAVLRAWPAVPVLLLLWPAFHGQLLDYADQVIGFDATLCLVACLAITPAITLAKAHISRLRWWYGNWVFVLGTGGLLIHLAYPPGSMGYRAAGTAVDWTGTLIVVLLLPMAVTSTTVAQKLLGPEWKRWQRVLVWSVWTVIGIHLGLMHVWPVLAAYLGATLPAAVIRQARVRRGIKAWRAGGYSTGGWWTALAVLAVVALTGVLALVVEEVISVARIFT